MTIKSDRFMGVETLPTRFPLGQDAVMSIRETIERSNKDLDKCAMLSASTGFDGA